MDRLRMIRRLFFAPPALRTALIAYPRNLGSTTTCRNYSSSLPGVSQSSFWANLIPKPLRRDVAQKNMSKNKKPGFWSREWNPATFYIVIFLLIGSMSIQMIALRNESEAYERRAEAKLGLLREIIERVQKGENVDVEGLLGTGNAAKEKEWEEVLQEIEREDNIWKKSQQSKPSAPPTSPNSGTSKPEATKADEIPKAQPSKSNAPSGFY